MIQYIKNFFVCKNKSGTNRDLGYDFIRFFAMLSVVIYHMITSLLDLRYHIASSLDYIIIHNPLILGYIGVALFFMLSGALLINKYVSNFNILNFYKTRFLRIEAANIVISVIVFWILFCYKNNIIFNDFLGLLISFLGLGYGEILWSKLHINTIWLAGAWFTAVIVVLYLLFPLLRWIFIKHLIIGNIFIPIVFLLNLEFEILTHYDGWFSITNGIMCFWMGMMFERYKHLFSNKKLIYFIFLLTILYWIINPQLFGKYKYFSCFVFSCFLFVSLYQIKFSNIFTNFVCKYNYEIYLIHQKLFLTALPLLLIRNYTYLQLFLVFSFLLLLVFLFSVCLQNIAKKFITISGLLKFLVLQFAIIILVQMSVVFNIL